MIDVTPGLAKNTTMNVDDAITAVATDKLLITGAKRGPGPVPARLDVDTFVNNERFVALYVQALRRSCIIIVYQIGTADVRVVRIHKTPEDQLTSFYQMAGLHGVPLVTWNQAEGSGSYCRHASPIFPTWHRPYVALFEVRSFSCWHKKMGPHRRRHSKLFKSMHSSLLKNTRPRRMSGERPLWTFVNLTGTGRSLAAPLLPPLSSVGRQYASIHQKDSSM